MKITLLDNGEANVDAAPKTSHMDGSGKDHAYSALALAAVLVVSGDCRVKLVYLV
jgi:hypothetical protein